jgi:hypothetical protein
MKFRTQTVARQMVVTFLAMLALTEGVWSVAQTQATGQTPASSRSVLLKEGTEIKLKLHAKITSKTAVDGDLVNLILAQDVRVGDITVARAGSVAVATALSRREGRNGGQTRRSWPEIGVPEG